MRLQHIFHLYTSQKRLSYEAASLSLDLREPTIGRSQVEPQRIEIFADPFQHLVMLFVLRVRHGIEQRWVTKRAATILRRTGILAGDASDFALARLRFELAFDLDFVPPVVAEIVAIHELCLRFGHAVQMHDGFIDQRKLRAEWIGHHRPVALAPDLELMQMLIFPAHRDLNHVMQVSQHDVARHQHAPPDRWRQFH